MSSKRLWIAVLAIPVCLFSVLIIGAQGSRPASASGVIDPTCTSSLPCIEYDNNGTGPGIRGISVSGNGLAGSTKFASTPATGRAGLIGNDIGTGRSNSGVHGLSVNGTGVSGLSTTGAGVNGASNYIGVAGSSTGYIGVFGTGPTYGVAGSSDSGVGVYGLSTSGAANGIGVQGLSSNGVGVNAVGGFFKSSTGDKFPALSIVGNTAGGPFNDLIDACPPSTANPCDRSQSVLSVDSAGDVATKGGVVAQQVAVFGKGLDLYQGYSSASALLFYVTDAGDVFAHSFSSGLAATRIQPTATGRSVRTYSQQSSEPSLEDFGEAQLSNGQAYVRISPDFANVVDPKANYLVFITPEGDANVLYVTEKSPSGFAVRESHEGRSTLMFSYRIVAKPFGSREARLPMLELPKLRATSASLPKQTRRFYPHP